MRTYGLLREKIKQRYGTIGDFAVAIKKDRSTISKKLNGIVPWDQDEIEECCVLLGIPISQVSCYFFYTE